MDDYTDPPEVFCITGMSVTVFNNREADWPGYTYMRDILRADGLPADKVDFVNGWVFRRWFPGDPIEATEKGWKPNEESATAELADALRCAQALVDPKWSLPSRYLNPPDPLRNHYFARPACYEKQSINGRTGFCSNCGTDCREDYT